MDAELASLVAAGADDATGMRVAADDDRLAAQLRVVALLDRREERVEIHMNDAEAAAGHRQIMARLRAHGEGPSATPPYPAVALRQTHTKAGPPHGWARFRK